MDGQGGKAQRAGKARWCGCVYAEGAARGVLSRGRSDGVEEQENRDEDEEEESKNFLKDGCPGHHRAGWVCVSAFGVRLQPGL